jgi:hypothetical protein
VRTFLFLALWAGFLAEYLFAETIQFQVSDSGDSLGLDHYSYFVNGITLQANQELEFQFPPNLFGTLSNGIAGNGFELVLLQPNNPPGTFGDYGVLALGNYTTSTRMFGVDFVYLGAGEPGPQPYSINQFDQNGNFISTVESGMTEPASQTEIPEPASFAPLVAGLLAMGGALWSVRRRSPGLGQWSKCWAKGNRKWLWCKLKPTERSVELRLVE